jgi:hypothetical protein
MMKKLPEGLLAANSLLIAAKIPQLTAGHDLMLQYPVKFKLLQTFLSTISNIG